MEPLMPQADFQILIPEPQLNLHWIQSTVMKGNETVRKAP